MASKGIRHGKQLIFWGLSGGFIGALLDWHYHMFPLFLVLVCLASNWFIISI